jgi:hypothetical protein
MLVCGIGSQTVGVLLASLDDNFQVRTIGIGGQDAPDSQIQEENPCARCERFLLLSACYRVFECGHMLIS